MRKVIAILISLIIVVFASFLWITRLSPRAKKAEKNVVNSLKLEVGMTSQEVLTIMGSPDEVRSNNSIDSILFYSPPFAASSGIDIEIRSDTVYRIYLFE